MLVDVGCSGGLDPGWRIFGDRLAAVGFDPAVGEIQRLTAAEINPKVRYVNGFVGLPLGHPLRGAALEPWRHDPWGRLSADRSQDIQCARRDGLQLQPPAHARPAYSPLAAAAVTPPLGVPAPPPAPVATPSEDDLELMRRNLWTKTALADPDRPIVLPAFLAIQGVREVDFIKIDVDGTDFEILQSLDGLLERTGALGVMLEVNYHGSPDPRFNSFHNVDRYMRAQGYDLFDLTVRKYSAAALPRPFIYAHPFAAQALGGRPVQGDALYLRDTGYLYRPGDRQDWSAGRLLKLAAVQCLFGLVDHAAELLLRYRERLEPLLNIDQALDVLTREIQALDPEHWAGREFSGYRDYVAAYEDDDPVFYDGLSRPVALRTQQEAARAEAEAQARQALEEALDAARAALAERDAAVRDRDLWRARSLGAEAELEATRASLSWRLTGGLRALRRLSR